MREISYLRVTGRYTPAEQAFMLALKEAGKITELQMIHLFKGLLDARILDE